MQNEEINKESKKNNWYKDRVMRKLRKQEDEYKEASPSWIFMNRVGGYLLDLLGWVLLIVLS